MAESVSPSLIFAWGNPSRGDDALGPLLLERLAAATDRQRGDCDCLTDFQLQIEHALDLRGRKRVLFVDASVSCVAPFQVSPLAAERDRSFTSHEMTPAALLQVYREIHGEAPPPSLLLAIRGERFELGEDLSVTAATHLEAALTWVEHWLAGG